MRIIDNAAISRRVCFDVSTHRNGPQMHNRTEASLTPAPSSVPKTHTYEFSVTTSQSAACAMATDNVGVRSVRGAVPPRVC